jgi:hypothetical protein
MTPEPKIIHLTALVLTAMQEIIRIDALHGSPYINEAFKYRLSKLRKANAEFIQYCSKISTFDLEELEELGQQLGEAQDEGLRELFENEK